MSINPAAMTVSKTEWATMQHVDVRTVTRWLAAGEVPGAAKLGTQWSIPAGAQRIERIQPAPPPATELDTIGHVPDMSGTMPALNRMLTLEEAADQLGTTIGGVRRLGDAGHLTIGRFGPNGSLRVFLA